MRSSLIRSSARTFGPAKLAVFPVCLSLALLISVGTVPELLAKKKDNDAAPSEQKRAVQALNRLTFGPRPGDVEQVMAMGVDRWIDLQLHPEKIPDSAMESRLAQFRTLHMSSKEIVDEFPDNPMVKQVMDGKKPMPSDPARRAVYQVQIARMQDKQERKEEKAERKEQKQEVAAASAPAASNASDSAKTETELATAAPASPDATPAVADKNEMAAPT